MSEKQRSVADRQIATDVFAIARALAAEIRRVGASVQLTVSQFATLELLNGGDMSVGELAKTLHVAMPTVTQSTDSLVGKGLVERYADERDRRHVRLRITDGGKALLRECHDALEEYVGQALTGWREDRKEQFATQLDIVREMVLQAELLRQG